MPDYRLRYGEPEQSADTGPTVVRDDCIARAIAAERVLATAQERLDAADGVAIDTGLRVRLWMDVEEATQRLATARQLAAEDDCDD